MSELVRKRKFLLEDRVYETELEGGSAHITTSRSGAVRQRERSFDDYASAHEWLLGEERKKLREGYMLHTSDVAIGEPSLLFAIPRAHVGPLPIARTDSGGIVTTCVSDSGKETMLMERTPAGDFYELDHRKNGLVMQLAPFGESLYQLVDHQVVLLDEEGESHVLTAKPAVPASTLTIDANRALWWNNGVLELVSLPNHGVIWSHPAQPTMYKANTCLAATVRGHWLAYSCAPGEVVVVNLQSGKDRRLRLSIEIVHQLVIASDQLYISEQYGKWGVYCVDLVSGDQAASWKVLQQRAGYVLALSEDGSHLAVERDQTITVYDTTSHTQRSQFSLEQAVRSSGIAWINETDIAVRMATGFVAVYRAL